MNRKDQDSAESPQPGSPLSADPKRAEVFDEVRRLVLLGIKAELPTRRSERELFQCADQMLLAMSRYSRGEITLEQCQSVFDEITAKLPRCFPPKPAWLDPTLASPLIQCVQQAKKYYPDAVHELLRWVNKELGKPRGAPISKELAPVYKRGARMRMQKLNSGQPPTWEAITKKLCPHRREKDHICTKLCVDRFRMGIKEYL
jgi:hypothetical protein